MSQTALSKLQFVAVGLAQTSLLFLLEDMAHLSHCEIKMANTTMEENALIVDFGFYFDKWSYIDHKESSHPADLMPAEVRMIFLQDENRKLTGEVSFGFFADDPVFNGRLEYLKGW